jgi:L-Ala-D/L-Glu epimerase
MQLNWNLYTHQLKFPFRIAHGEYTQRKALIVQMSFNGYQGYGECTEIDYYHINLGEYTHLLTSLQKKWQHLDPATTSPSLFFEELDLLGLPNFLQSALDCAFWDLYGKIKQISFLDLHHFPFKLPLLSSITISVDKLDVQINAIRHSDWPMFKVKVDTWSDEIRDELLQLNKPIAIDANGSFTPEMCRQIQEDPLSAQFIYFEQPMKKGWENFTVLRKDGFANWMADEDFQSISDLLGIASHYNSVNVKVMKCGGISSAKELIERARELDLKIMIGCMTESTVGISAGMSLAALADYLDLDGANLLANDPAKGWYLEKGVLHYTTTPGLGISM